MIRIYKGRSVHETFSVGDRLSIEDVQLASVRPGEVEMNRIQNHRGVQDLRVHRLMGVATDGLVVRGRDNNPCERQPYYSCFTKLGEKFHLVMNTAS